MSWFKCGGFMFYIEMHDRLSVVFVYDYQPSLCLSAGFKSSISILLITLDDLENVENEKH